MKQLLLKDLCARMPYGVICRITDNKKVGVKINTEIYDSRNMVLVVKIIGIMLIFIFLIGLILFIHGLLTAPIIDDI